jgi:predicted short-subunit dehydrogenase-like oxidoreductase (DUF2520 family)
MERPEAAAPAHGAIHYAVLGSGRLAQHMRHYLQLLGLPCSGWARNSASACNSHADSDPGERLRRAIAPASHVLLLVSDGAIPGLLRKYPFLHGRTLVHCAGALSLPGVAGAHPLMTFSHELYTLEHYRSVPFLVEQGYDFARVLPGLPNPHHCVQVEQKALYHALCVAAGNFPQILWQAVAQRFDRQLQVPAEVLQPYLRQVLANFTADPQGALTGPLARGDDATIARNLAALEQDPLQALYQAFGDFYRAEQTAAADNAALQEQGR